MILSLAVLSTALLFGGMTLYSFGFAAFLFTALPAQTAGAALRRAFPLFYGFVIVTAAVAALLWWSHDTKFAVLMAVVAATTVLVRQILMPAINRATDAGRRQRFKWLHGLSVLVTLGHIAATGWLLAQLV
jgi:ABC-type transport system involved in multi-copper enzyme maturation permease subunit